MTQAEGSFWGFIIPVIFWIFWSLWPRKGESGLWDRNPNEERLVDHNSTLIFKGEDMAATLLTPNFEVLSPKTQDKIKEIVEDIMNKSVSKGKSQALYTEMALIYREWCRNRKEYIQKVLKKE